MARPLFAVHHFIACRRASWAGPASPLTPRNLEGVSYEYVVPASAALPLLLYARFYLTNACSGTRKFEADLYWIDAPPGQKQWVDVLKLSKIIFEPGVPVVSAAWEVPDLRFPGRGRFELRLTCDFDLHEDGFDAPIAVETILIE